MAFTNYYIQLIIGIIIIFLNVVIYKYANWEHNFYIELTIGIIILLLNILIYKYANWGHNINLLIKLIIFLVIFSLFYFILSSHDEKTHFKKEKDHLKKVSLWDCFYFTVITQSTIGYGNMRPSTRWAEILVVVQAISTMLVITQMTMLKI